MRKKDIKKWEAFPEAEKKRIIKALDIIPESLPDAMEFNDDGTITIDYLKIRRPSPQSWVVANDMLTDAMLDALKKDYEDTEACVMAFKTTYDALCGAQKYKKLADRCYWLVNYTQARIRNVIAMIDRDPEGRGAYCNNIKYLLKIFFNDSKMIDA